MKVAPPALREAGVKFEFTLRRDWTHFLNIRRNLAAESSHSRSCLFWRVEHAHVTQLHTSGCTITTNCECPNWRKFFGLVIRRVMQGAPKDNWLGNPMSIWRNLRISPGRNMPKNPSPTRQLKIRHRCCSFGSSARSAYNLDLQRIETSSTIGRGDLNWEGLCSSQAFIVAQLAFNFCLNLGLTTWMNNTPCFAIRRAPFLVARMSYNEFTNASNQQSTSFALAVKTRSSEEFFDRRKCCRKVPPSSKRCR